jgi:hypothetical protein
VAVYSLPDLSADDLREDDLRDDHLENDKETYIEFLNSQSMDDASRQDYNMEVGCLRQKGYWSNSVADVLPLALANWSKRGVRIYSSDPRTPVIYVHPKSVQNENPIILAFISASGLASHYDACSRK